MTEKQLQQIEQRANEATPGPWYAHATDDDYSSNARYVSLQPGNVFHHDQKQGMAEGSPDQANPKKVIAITLLQEPQLAQVEECDENALFIAHARTDVPLLVAEVRRLQTEVANLISRLRNTLD